jgi:hypothetical protein
MPSPTTLLGVWSWMSCSSYSLSALAPCLGAARTPNSSSASIIFGLPKDGRRGTATGAKPSTASEGLLARLAASGGAFTADDITFSVRTMLDEDAQALPGSWAALKSIAKEPEIAVVREGLGLRTSPGVSRRLTNCTALLG